MTPDEIAPPIVKDHLVYGDLKIVGLTLREWMESCPADDLVRVMRLSNGFRWLQRKSDNQIYLMTEAEGDDK